MREAIARAPCTLSFDGLSIRIGEVDVSGADGVTFDGAGATILPASQTGGRFTGLHFGAIAFTRFRFVQRAGWNYNAAIGLLSGETVVLDGLHFSGCGFGAHVQSVKIVRFDNIVLRQIGIYPRPRPLDPGPAGFGASFEIYGGGLRANFCDQVIFGDAIDFENEQPAGGHLNDRTGGPGGCTTLASNDVVFGAGRVVNAPGQGFAAAGEWQGQDLVGQMLAGKFNPRLRGQRIVFRGSRATGCNQEGCTAFGVTDVAFENVVSWNNRAADLEIWQSYRGRISGGRAWEDASGSHPLREPGKLAGRGAVHIIDSSDVVVDGVHILRSRHNGIDVGGSQKVAIRNCRIDDYGIDDGVSYLASGIACGPGATPRIARDIAIGPGNVFSRRSSTESRGADIFAQDPRQRLYDWGNSAGNRAVSYVNAPQAIRRQQAPFSPRSPASVARG
ncbi:right-handed parallel beta-helix repeat-containing protein [Sphingomonas qomolangmaensis]|uniref:Right-handed parallel beta-helix repeat-containing protein n=1 Tax=Sphingomonas qomolangmaensis TaxID=2918765 RepID=A0ABY5L9D4_9SPHN|nr:right-handed parallel beta-helix repeat-containing protein [Sphingomonas qomolangmaensis]UUL82188.1 right-handed parallel beta-helix repeat-containing protein [Sphingomonas qomolangmaensis]